MVHLLGSFLMIPREIDQEFHRQKYLVCAIMAIVTMISIAIYITSFLSVAWCITNPSFNLYWCSLHSWIKVLFPRVFRLSTMTSNATDANLLPTYIDHERPLAPLGNNRILIRRTGNHKKSYSRKKWVEGRADGRRYLSINLVYNSADTWNQECQYRRWEIIRLSESPERIMTKRHSIVSSTTGSRLTTNARRHHILLWQTGVRDVLQYRKAQIHRVINI